MEKIKILFVVCLLTFLASCKKDDINSSDATNINGLGGDTWVKGPIDHWIYDTLTIPYNISTKYKWDQFEGSDFLSRTLVPPKEEVIVPLLSSIKRVWINNFISEAGEIFFKRLSPKFIYMIGSPAYEDDGSIVQGTAEGGRKIILLDVNRTRVKGMAGYTRSDSTFLKRMFHVIEHEFGHILHQNIKYPASFEDINPQHYTAEWINYSKAGALADGFITNYSMNNANDDFVEMMAVMLTEGKDGYERMLASIPNATSPRGITRAQALARLRAKESIMVTYFKEAWNIDFYRLQSKTRASIVELIY
jgi:substrate import-associated zinc metallohydrolase lipoprotein